IPRPRGPRAQALARTAAGRPARGLRDELRQVRGRRPRGLPRLAQARAADRAAEAARRHGRRRAGVRERARIPVVAIARADPGRAAALHTDDRGARRTRHRLLARRAGREDGVLERLQADRRVVGRAAALLVILAALVAWYEAAPHLGGMSAWHSIALIAV